jgi:TPR repeat protein
VSRDSKDFKLSDSAFHLSPKELLKFLKTPGSYKAWLATADTAQKKIQMLCTILQAIEAYWELYCNQYPPMSELSELIIKWINELTDLFITRKNSRIIDRDDFHLMEKLLDNLNFFKNQKVIFDNTSKTRCKFHELLKVLDYSIHVEKESKPQFNVRNILALIKTFYDCQAMNLSSTVQSVSILGQLAHADHIHLISTVHVDFLLESKSAAMSKAEEALLLTALGSLAIKQRIYGQSVDPINNLLSNLVSREGTLSSVQIGRAIQGVRNLVEAQSLGDVDRLDLTSFPHLLKHFLDNSPKPSTTQIASIIDNLAEIYNNVNTVEENPLQFEILQKLWILFLAQNKKAMETQNPAPSYTHLAKNISTIMLGMSNIVRINRTFYADINTSGFIEKIEALFHQLFDITEKQSIKSRGFLSYDMVKSIITSLRASVLLGRSSPVDDNYDPAALLFSKVKTNQKVILTRRDDKHILIDKLMFYAVVAKKKCTDEMKSVFDKNQPEQPDSTSREAKIARELKALHFSTVKFERNLDYYPLDICAEIEINNKIIIINIELDGPSHNDLVGNAKNIIRDKLIRLQGKVHDILRIPYDKNMTPQKIAEMALAMAKKCYQTMAAVDKEKQKKKTKPARKKTVSTAAKPKKEPFNSEKGALIRALATLEEKEEFTPQETPESLPTLTPPSTPVTKKQATPKKSKELKMEQPKFTISSGKIKSSGSLRLRAGQLLCATDFFLYRPNLSKKDVDILIRLANEGNAWAQNDIGVSSLTGGGLLPSNIDKGRELLSISSAAGNHYAKYNLASAYIKGRGFTQNYLTAVQLLEEIIDHVDAAPYHIALLYDEGGPGLARNEKKAIEYMLLAAQKGSAQAQCELALLYQKGGAGIGQNDQKAVQYFRLAAEQDLVEAQFWLGSLYQKGECGLPKDDQKAFEQFKLAAEKNLADAQFELAKAYEKGQGVELNLTEARRWLRAAAKLNYDPAKQKIANELLKESKGVSKEGEKEAFELYSTIDSKEFPQVYMSLGQCYRDGTGVKKNKNKAFKLFKLAKEEGFNEAFILLGQCYFNGWGVKKNQNKAVRLYREAADGGGFAEAQFHLGLCYKDGSGVTANPHEALKYIGLASRQGLRDAQDKLVEVGIGLYQEGIQEIKAEKSSVKIMSPKLVEAEKWLELAKQHGIVAATQCLERLKIIKLLVKSTAGEIKIDENQIKFEIFMRATQSGNPNGLVALQELYGAIEISPPSKYQERALQFLQQNNARPCPCLPCQTALADSYLTNQDEDNREKAITILAKAAEQNFPPAQYNLGKRYYLGDGVPQDREKGLALLNLAWENKNTDAQHFLANLYYQNARAETQNREAALELYRLAATYGCADSQRILGIHCLKTEQFSKALDYFSTLARNGFASGPYWLGICYIEGHGVEKNEKTAALGWQWIQLAAKNNYPDAMHYLVSRDIRSPLSPEGVQNAITLLRGAAAQGHTASQGLLAIFYLGWYNKKYNLNIDQKPEGVQLLKTAAEKKYQRSQYVFACLLLRGLYVEANVEKAIQMLQSLTSFPYAQFTLAQCYKTGHGVVQDSKEADRLFQLAAEKGVNKDPWTTIIGETDPVTTSVATTSSSSSSSSSSSFFGAQQGTKQTSKDKDKEETPSLTS